MGAGEWIGVASIVVPVVGSVLGVGVRILVRLGQLEQDFQDERADRLKLSEMLDEHLHSRSHIRRA